MYAYTIKYVDEDGKMLADPINETKSFGETVTAKALENILGYELKDADKSVQEIIISDTANEITFVYTKKTYDVRFITDGNGSLDGNTESSVKYQETVENVPIPNANLGYTFIGWYDENGRLINNPKDVSIEKNTTFTAKFERLYDVTFEIETEEGTLNGVTDYKVLKDTSTGNQPTVEANEHYNFIGWKIKNGSEQLVEPSTTIITADTIFKAILLPKEYHYTVEYVDTEGNRLADAVIGTQTYGENAVEEAINIEHYTLQGETTQIVLIDGDNKVITFVYDINKYPVHFVADDNGTVKGEETVINQTIEYNKTISELPIPEANAGYHFAGWYMGEEKIEDPTQVSIVEDTTFIAKFEKVEETTVPSKPDKSENINSNLTEKPANATQVNTGDTTTITLYVVLLIISLCGLITIKKHIWKKS